jgi:hypothetical protein
MKKIIITTIALIFVFAAFAQEEEDKPKKKLFTKENLFTGGSLTASFYNGGTVLGVNPFFGYSINRFIDAGVVLNFTYTGIKDYSGDKYRQYVYGPGVFARIFPVNMIFVQGTFEHNFISETYKPAFGGPTQKYKIDANSLLVGGGYCNGREGQGSTFYYFSILFDVTKNDNSPYVERLRDGSYRALPIVRAGIQIPLFQGGGRRRRSDD